MYSVPHFPMGFNAFQFPQLGFQNRWMSPMMSWIPPFMQQFPIPQTPQLQAPVPYQQQTPVPYQQQTPFPYQQQTPFPYQQQFQFPYQQQFQFPYQQQFQFPKFGFNQPFFGRQLPFSNYNYGFNVPYTNFQYGQYGCVPPVQNIPFKADETRVWGGRLGDLDFETYGTETPFHTATVTPYCPPAFAGV